MVIHGIRSISGPFAFTDNICLFVRFAQNYRFLKVSGLGSGGGMGQLPLLQYFFSKVHNLKFSNLAILPK